MVDVRVREHDDVDVFRSEAEIAIAVDGFGAPSLKQAAVEEHSRFFGVHDVAGASHIAADGSYELNLHAKLSSCGRR